MQWKPILSNSLKIDLLVKKRKDDESSTSEEDDDDAAEYAKRRKIGSSSEKTKTSGLNFNSNSSDSDSDGGYAAKSNTTTQNSKQSKRNTVCYELLGSSDEEDVEVVNVQKSRIPPVGVRPNFSNDLLQAQLRAARQRNPYINNGINQVNYNALQKAYEARKQLMEAQRMAVTTLPLDMEEPILSPRLTDANNFDYASLTPAPAMKKNPYLSAYSAISQDVSPVSAVKKTNPYLSAYTAVSQDKPAEKIQITLRTSQSQKSVFTISENDPFLKLMNVFQQKHKLSTTNVISFQVDGEFVVMTDTPKKFDLESGDIVDVILKDRQGNKVDLESAGAATKIIPSNAPVVIKTRIINPKPSSFSAQMSLASNEDLWQLQTTDPFRKLVNAFAAKRNVPNPERLMLLYNNKLLNFNSLPLEIGIKGGNPITNPVVIDIRLPQDVQNIVASFSTSNQGENIVRIHGNKVTFRLRINGNDKNIQELSIGDLNTFELLMLRFCQKNNKNENQVTFLLDGDKLNAKATPKGEDLEGGEIIDVLVKGQYTPPVVSPLMDQNEIITVRTIRNKTKFTPKHFKVKRSDTILTLKKQYQKFYRGRGCQSVLFYFQNKVIDDGKNAVSFQSLGIKNMDCIHAMENGQILML